MSLVSPPRLRGHEFLDDPGVDPAVARRSLADIERCNRLFGGTRAVLAELRPLLAEARAERRALTLLDVGTGAGDIPAVAREEAARSGVRLDTIGVEVSHALTSAARARCGEAVAGDARNLPFATAVVDIVTCSQVLHHFATPDAERLLAECTRVARRRVIVSELRRAWSAAVGVWLASWPLGFHPVSRHDGVVSIFRGFLVPELAQLVRRATGCSAAVRNRPGFRVTASWDPA